METCYNPIIIKKTFETQKEDLLNILYFDEPLTWSQIHEYWRDALELRIEPVGWNALWKVSRDFCKTFNIPYPTTLSVQVININLNNNKFVANVLIIFAEDDRNIPEEVSAVPLVQLFPTISQRYEAINIANTADILHDLRVFYLHLWYPWDEKLSESDWLTTHFENRLQLYYDTSSGEIDPKVCFNIGVLIEDGKDLYKQIVELEEQLMDIDSDNCLSPSKEAVTSDLRYLSLCELQVELSHIAEQLNMYEDKNYRYLLEKKKKKEMEQSNNENVCKNLLDNKEENEKIDSENTLSLAWCGGTPAEFSSFVNKINVSLTTDARMRVECSDSLNKLLSDWKLRSPYGRLFLSKGVYCVNSRTLINVRECIIEGFDHRDSVIIKDIEHRVCLFDIRCEKIKICDLFINTGKVKYALLVRSGICHLNNVKIGNEDKTEIGVFVAAGAQLFADNCQFYNCSTAIEAEKNSSIVLTNCLFADNINGLEFDKGSISIESCQFINNKGYALLMENAELDFPNVKEGADVLEGFEKVRLISSEFKGNKCDMAKYY